MLVICAPGTGPTSVTARSCPAAAAMTSNAGQSRSGPDRQLRHQCPGRQARRHRLVLHAALRRRSDLPRAARQRRRPADDGVFGVELEGFARSEQAYDPSTAILRTRLFDAARRGHRDRRFLPALLQPRPRRSGRRSSCAGCGRWSATRGFASSCARAANGAAAAPEITRGSNHLRFVLPGGTLRLNTNAPLDLRRSTAPGSRCRSPVSLLLGPDETLSAGIEETARDFEEQTALYWRRWTRAPRRAARVAGRGDPRGDHAQAVPVRGDRRDRRGDDDQHPGGAEQRAQLGLPLLLAARRLLRRPRAEQPVRSRHDGGLPALAQRRRAQRRRRACPAAVRDRPREDADREHRAARCRAIAAWARCGSATRPSSTSSTTCTATSSSARRRRSSTTGCSAAPTCATSPSSKAWASRPGASTTSPTPACGSCARARACTPRRR